jgi:hypothetical protein
MIVHELLDQLSLSICYHHLEELQCNDMLSFDMVVC